MKLRISSKSAKLAKPAVFGIGGGRGVNQTQISGLPSLPFSELEPFKHTLKD